MPDKPLRVSATAWLSVQSHLRTRPAITPATWRGAGPQTTLCNTWEGRIFQKEAAAGMEEENISPKQLIGTFYTVFKVGST